MRRRWITVVVATAIVGPTGKAPLAATDILAEYSGMASPRTGGDGDPRRGKLGGLGWPVPSQKPPSRAARPFDSPRPPPPTDTPAAPRRGHAGEIVMRVGGYVIHLERAAGRRPQAYELVRLLPVPTRILAAIDGRTLDDDARRRFVRRQIHAPRYPFPLLDAEVGCFLSYRAAWRSILEDGWEAGLIVEDDVAAAAPQFAAVIAAANAAIEPHEYVRFPLLERTDRGPVTRSLGPATFIEPRLPGLGMQMQLVGREAARRLLAQLKTLEHEGYSFVQMQWLHGARVLTARPIVIREICAELGGSVIHAPRTGIVHKVVHEFQRPLIRLAVHRANERWRRRAA